MDCLNPCLGVIYVMSMMIHDLMNSFHSQTGVWLLFYQHITLSLLSRVVLWVVICSGVQTLEGIVHDHKVLNTHCVTLGAISSQSYTEGLPLSFATRSVADALTSSHWFAGKCVCRCAFYSECVGVMCLLLAAEIIRTQLFCCPCRPQIQLLSSNIGQLWQSPQHGHWSALLGLSYRKYEHARARPAFLHGQYDEHVHRGLSLCVHTLWFLHQWCAGCVSSEKFTHASAAHQFSANE